MKYQFPHVREVSFSIPNGARVSITQAQMLKSTGLTAGIPDIFIAVPRGKYHGFFIEFKYGYNTESEKQLEKHRLLRHQGYKVETIYDLETAIEEVNKYLKQ